MLRLSGKGEERMYLNDILRVCLLALESRYPVHSLNVHASLLKTFAGEREGWSAEEIMRWLEEVDPALLEQPAILHIDASTSAIFVPTYLQQEPAFYLHCQGHIPACHPHQVEYESKLLPAIC